MDSALPQSGGFTGSQAAALLCDYEPLQKCLAANKGDRTKCLKEWDDFKRACSSIPRRDGQEVPKG
ncbi:hypothetical protein DFJ74DRAFT_707470 [Hyaloraphidium curvatum]|nr:hypothetical protein DFJ74DRAFT_707470 [Hyaloraphidium curvatum]